MARKPQKQPPPNLGRFSHFVKFFNHPQHGPSYKVFDNHPVGKPLEGRLNRHFAEELREIGCTFVYSRVDPTDATLSSKLESAVEDASCMLLRYVYDADNKARGFHYREGMVTSFWFDSFERDIELRVAEVPDIADKWAEITAWVGGRIAEVKSTITVAKERVQALKQKYPALHWTINPELSDWQPCANLSRPGEPITYDDIRLYLHVAERDDGFRIKKGNNNFEEHYRTPSTGPATNVIVFAGVAFGGSDSGYVMYYAQNLSNDEGEILVCMARKEKDTSKTVLDVLSDLMVDVLSVYHQIAKGFPQTQALLASGLIKQISLKEEMERAYQIEDEDETEGETKGGVSE